jgi:hypothetical protein
MKRRHAAALALVGWYLMVPPWSAPGKFNASAPLPQWKQDRSFDSATTCEQYRTSAIKYLTANKEHVDKVVIAYNGRLYQSALCVQTDDPRLKRN